MRNIIKIVEGRERFLFITILIILCPSYAKVLVVARKTSIKALRIYRLKLHSRYFNILLGFPEAVMKISGCQHLMGMLLVSAKSDILGLKAVRINWSNGVRQSQRHYSSQKRFGLRPEVSWKFAQIPEVIYKGAIAGSLRRNKLSRVNEVLPRSQEGRRSLNGSRLDEYRRNSSKEIPVARNI